MIFNVIFIISIKDKMVLFFLNVELIKIRYCLRNYYEKLILNVWEVEEFKSFMIIIDY